MIRALALLLIFTVAAAAHDHYPAECCNGNDCVAVPCGEIEQLGEQHWRHGDVQFFANNVRPPRDERCHVCEWGTIGRCIFFPVLSMS